MRFILSRTFFFLSGILDPRTGPGKPCLTQRHVRQRLLEARRMRGAHELLFAPLYPTRAWRACFQMSIFCFFLPNGWPYQSAPNPGISYRPLLWGDGSAAVRLARGEGRSLVADEKTIWV